MATTTAFQVGDYAVIAASGTGMYGHEGVVTSVSRFHRLRRRPQSVRLRLLCPGTAAARTIRFAASDLCPWVPRRTQ